ncbi:uncharacterized protein A1O5_07134 [Cladophialophora psammophila CBS 110553]|uniref:Major facilitator superfamily (MFS) profile domain-containing protein n=1 Tax=Cladophialophora psammophila CBS 110553 TaxID=1182543 RepID=W9WZF8_9EURO|nr:uncharacterized protein A1O5_07134 [Cladophialophora psammophila CBS 110553]EXJ70061.1 hypothetical protein A1O5_07134 [Cladophialophora psammophila CBS 110553]
MVPEWRMSIWLTGAVAFPVGLFWFAWTAAYPIYVHWIVPSASGVATGYGLLTKFIGCFNFILDVYRTNSASAFAIATISRSALATGFPRFAKQMLHNLSVPWANTLLGCFATLLVPVPICFWLRGPQIRARSSFAVDNVFFPNQGGGDKKQEGAPNDRDVARADMEIGRAVHPNISGRGRDEGRPEMNAMDSDSTVVSSV